MNLKEYVQFGCTFVLFTYQGAPGATGEPGKMLSNNNENVSSFSDNICKHYSSVKEQFKHILLSLNILFVFQDIRNVRQMVSVHYYIKEDAF